MSRPSSVATRPRSASVKSTARQLPGGPTKGISRPVATRVAPRRTNSWPVPVARYRSSAATRNPVPGIDGTGAVTAPSAAASTTAPAAVVDRIRPAGVELPPDESTDATTAAAAITTASPTTPRRRRARRTAGAGAGRGRAGPPSSLRPSLRLAGGGARSNQPAASASGPDLSPDACDLGIVSRVATGWATCGPLRHVAATARTTQHRQQRTRPLVPPRAAAGRLAPRVCYPPWSPSASSASKAPRIMHRSRKAS